MKGNSPGTEPVARFPLRAMTIGVVAMIFIAIVSAATTWSVGNRIRSTSQSQFNVITTSEQLQRQGDLLALLATLAVTTGEQAYVDRYSRLQAGQEESLRQLEDSIQLPENRAAFARAEQSRQGIEKLERSALRAAIEGDRGPARAMLASTEYQQLLDSYRGRLAEIQSRSRGFVDTSRRQTDRYLLINLLASLIALLMIAAGWLLLVRPARTYAAQLRSAQKAAESATRAKSDFLAVMSHEIRTPLNSILGFAELLLNSGKLKREERHQAELIASAGSMLLTVVNDLLDFSKIEAGKIELVPEPFAVETLVDNSVSIVRGAAEAKGLELRIEIDPNLSTYYLGDEDRLRQVLLNLLNNAVKFTSVGSVSLSVLRWSAGTETDRLRFSITDTGEGIGEKQQRQLFQPFTQAEASITRRFGGTGLGLSISKRLIELMGGEIGFASTPGRGSSFWFEVGLPKASALTEPSAADTTRTSRPGLILVAEDLQMNQELARAMLERAGHEVDIVGNGVEAVRAVQGRAYDVVLMDIQMPRMDGISATKAIRELPGPERDVPILALTANVLPDQLRSFLAAGMNGHVAKPARQKELHAAISAAMAGRVPPGGAVGGADPPLDSQLFDDVADAIPRESLERHVRSLEEQVVQVASGSITDRGELEAMAHKIVSQAGMLGLQRLSEAARELEQVARERADVSIALGNFGKAAGDIEKELWPRLRNTE